MARSEEEVIIRETAKSTAINWGTNAPFEIVGSIQIRKVGFAGDHVVRIQIACKDESLSALTPVARQIVFRELETHGLESEILEYTPSVGCESSRRYKFTDCNESSPTKGERKYGKLRHWTFRIKPEHVGHFEWDWKTGKFPERKAS